jgi:hypothetical protein
MTLAPLWSPDTLFFLIVGIAAIVIARKAWQWKASLDRCDVTTHEPPPLPRDPVQDFHRTVGSLHGPASKGFDAQQGDRRAHVHAMQRRRPS